MLKFLFAFALTVPIGLCSFSKGHAADYIEPGTSSDLYTIFCDTKEQIIEINDAHTAGGLAGAQAALNNIEGCKTLRMHVRALRSVGEIEIHQEGEVKQAWIVAVEPMVIYHNRQRIAILPGQVIHFMSLIPVVEPPADFKTENPVTDDVSI